MKRRVCAALLALVLALTLLPAAAFAEEPPENGAPVEDDGSGVPSEPSGGDEGDNETPGDPSEDEEPNETPNEPDGGEGDGNTPGSEPGGDEGDGNVPGGEPDGSEGGNTPPTPQPNLAPTVAEAANDMMDWDTLVEAINGGSTSITLGDDVSREGSTKEIVISQGKTVTINLNGYTLDGGGKGPVITVEEGGTLTIVDEPGDGREANGVITGGETSSNGGGIYVNGGTLTMEGGAISGNQAENGGGVYLTNGATFTMTGGEISENKLNVQHSTGYGGGVYVGRNCEFSVTASETDPVVIKNNTAVDNGDWGDNQYAGGGIAVDRGTLNLSHARIEGNSAANNQGWTGGGIYANYSIVTITDSEITNNSGFIRDSEEDGDWLLQESGGGIMAHTDTILTMTRTKVSGNTALLGAGIYLSGTQSAEITDCVITENKTLRDSDPSSFSYGNPSLGGGILFRTSGGGLTPPGGGGSDEPAPEYALTITNSTISKNSAVQAGGGLARLSGSMLVDGNTTITENDAPQGGGVWVQGASEVYFQETSITGNQASLEGGGLRIGEGTVNLTETKIDNNTTEGAAGGVYNAGTVKMTSGSISANTAAEAGGIANVGGTVTFSGGTISNNTADMAGGVENVGTFKMSGGTITGNKATGTSEDGGEDGKGVGGGVVNLGTFTMTGGAIYGNEAATGGDDFYNYGEPPKAEGGLDVGVDDSWDGNHNMGLESLSAPRADDEHGTFTLIPATNFGYSGWYNDEPDARYEDTDNPTEYEVKEGDTTLQYLTLGEKLEPNLTLWYYQVYLRDDSDTTWLLWKHGQGGWAEPTAAVEIKASDFEGQSLGWGSTLGDSYTHDSDNPDKRLSADAQEATQTNPLKIYFEKKS